MCVSVRCAGFVNSAFVSASVACRPSNRHSSERRQKKKKNLYSTKHTEIQRYKYLSNAMEWRRWSVRQHSVRKCTEHALPFFPHKSKQMGSVLSHFNPFCLPASCYPKCQHYCPSCARVHKFSKNPGAVLVNQLLPT